MSGAAESASWRVEPDGIELRTLSLVECVVARARGSVLQPEPPPFPLVGRLQVCLGDGAVDRSVVVLLPTVERVRGGGGARACGGSVGRRARGGGERIFRPPCPTCRGDEKGRAGGESGPSGSLWSDLWMSFSEALTLGEAVGLIVDVAVLVGAVDGKSSSSGEARSGDSLLETASAVVPRFEAEYARLCAEEGASLSAPEREGGGSARGERVSLYRAAGGRGERAGFAKPISLARTTREEVVVDLSIAARATEEYMVGLSARGEGVGAGGSELGQGVGSAIYAVVRALSVDGGVGGAAFGGAGGALSVAGESPGSAGLWRAVRAALRVVRGSQLPGYPLEPSVCLPYGVVETVGRRRYMEDRHVARGRLGGATTQSLYAVFDGHGGARAAEFCRRQLPVALDKRMRRGGGASMGAMLRECFHEVDTSFCTEANRRFPQWDDGTTAVVAVVRENRLTVAHAGDSRAVLVRANGTSEGLTRDHKPDREDETMRIAALGGSVETLGVPRVNGILAVSRAIGDRLLKPSVTGDPEVCDLTLAPDHAWLVLASDGLFDVIDNRDVAPVLRDVHDATAAAERLVHYALARRSQDNITVLVVDLRQLR